MLNYNLTSLAETGGEWFEHKDIEGRPMLCKEISLMQPILNMFDMVVISKYDDGTVIYDMLSKRYAPNNDLRIFINNCYEWLGVDKNGNGICTLDDMEPLKRGTYSRLWDNVKILQTKRADCFSLVMALRIIDNNN